MPHRCGANGVDIRRAHRTTATQCSPDLRRRAERRVQTDPAFTIFEVLRCGKTQIKFAFALGLIAIFDFVLDTPPRQSTNKFVFALGLIPIFDFVLDTPPRQNANKFAFALGLIVSLQKIEGDSTIFAGLFARLRSSLEDKIRFGQVQTTDARNIHRRHLQTLPCKEEEKEENRKLSLTCRSPFTIFVEDRIRL